MKRFIGGMLCMWLGCATEESCPLPIGDPRYVELATDGFAVMALRSDGAAVCWARDRSGQCGLPFVGSDAPPRHTSVPTCASSIQLNQSSGTAIRADGRLVVWGTEQAEEFGDGTGTTERYGEPVILPIPERVVDGEINHGYAVTESGALYAWGFANDSSVPRLYPWPTRIKMVRANEHACILDEHGDVYCKAGKNEFGVVGDGTTEPRVEFTRSLLPGAATYLAVGFSVTYAVLEDGRVYQWGRDLKDQSTPTPRMFEGIAGVTRLRVAPPSAPGGCAFRPGGKAACWGAAMTQIPDHTFTPGVRPFDVYDDVLDMALSEYGNGCVLRASDHKVYCVGSLSGYRCLPPDPCEEAMVWKEIPVPGGTLDP